MILAADSAITLLADQILSLVVMFVLLLFSAFFSGSETALFSLTAVSYTHLTLPTN